MSGTSQLPWSPTAPATHGARRAVWVGSVVVVVIGTFLPWFRSGRVQRNSYELAGVGVRRLQAADWVETPLRAWPFLGVLWAVAVVVLLLGRTRIAGLLATALGVLTGLVALGGIALAVRLDSSLLAGTLVGPVVTVVGAIAVVLASVPMLRRRHRPSSRGGFSPTGATNPPPESV